MTVGPRRVVVTGCGVVTPIGSTLPEFWDSLTWGRCGITTLPAGLVDTDRGVSVSVAGQVHDFDPAPYMPRSVSRRLDRFAQFGVAAAVQAIAMSGLPVGPPPDERTGVLIGSGYGAIGSIIAAAETAAAKGSRSVSPFFSITSAMDSAAGEIGMRIGAGGPTRALSSACATGTDAIGEAARWIRAGDADVVVAGAAESCLTRLDLASNDNARALSRCADPASACRPFDEDRDGFVMSEGAGVLVLEDETHARRRGANVLVEVAGYGSSSDAHHWTAPHPDGAGARRAMVAALADAGAAPQDVDYVNTHGTGTVLNDPVEIEAIRAVLASRLAEIPVSSIKSMTGHLLGAAGAVEAIATVRTLLTGLVPPTVNCRRPIAADVNFVVGLYQDHDVDLALTNSFGFGGHNAVLALRRWQPIFHRRPGW